MKRPVASFRTLEPPEDPSPGGAAAIGKEAMLRTLWRCTLQVGRELQDFLFRSTESFDTASRDALDLVEGSPAVEMAGARIIKVERVARLWN
jgi:hypothetical protein